MDVNRGDTDFKGVWPPKRVSLTLSYYPTASPASAAMPEPAPRPATAPQAKTEKKPGRSSGGKEEIPADLLRKERAVRSAEPRVPAAVEKVRKTPVGERNGTAATLQSDQSVSAFKSGMQAPVDVRKPPSGERNIDKKSAFPAGSAARMQEAKPIYRLNPPPEYPRLALRKRYQGRVLLEVLVMRDGRVSELRILESSGHHILDKAALRSIRNWLFEPARRGEEPIDMWVRVPVRFKIQ
jgi:protein TonB